MRELRHGGTTVFLTTHLASAAVWQIFAVLVPLCVLVLAWATRVFRQAVS